MNTNSPYHRPKALLTSHVRPENWNPRTGSHFFDWEVIVNDWFIYTVDWREGTVEHSVQLLANRDNRYTIIRSPSFCRKKGVFTSHERRAAKEIFSPANLPAYEADGLGKFERILGPRSPVLRLGLWVTPGRPPASACWGGDQLSPATQHLITTFDRFLGISDLVALSSSKHRTNVVFPW